MRDDCCECRECSQQVANESVAERVQELMVDEKLSDAKSYSPFRRVNLEEFLQNMDDDAITILHNWMADNQFVGKHFEQLGLAFYANAIEYWERLATAKAEREAYKEP